MLNQLNESNMLCMMKRLLLVSVLSACFSMARADEVERGYCGNYQIDCWQNICYVLTDDNGERTLTIFRNPNADGFGYDDFKMGTGLSFEDLNPTILIIEDGVTGIGKSAFLGCSVLTSVTIGDSVISIGEQAFSGCSNLTSINIGNSVTSIGENAFEGCSSLTSIKIPNSVTTIGDYAFYGCTGLTSITIPNSVTTIGNSAFSDCNGLTSVTIPNSVTTIGNSAFRGCI